MFKLFSLIWQFAPKTSLAYSYFRVGHRYYVDGRLEESIRLFDSAISLISSYSPFYSSRGRALFELGRYDEALSDFQKAIVLAPSDSIALEYHRRLISRCLIDVTS